MNIRYYRELNGLLQVDLAKKLEVDQGAISKWENGVTKPRRKYLKKMARMFGCTEDDLLKE